MSQPASASGLSGLPVEIMEFVVEHMLESNYEGSLAALGATCRGLHAIVMPRLYSKETMDKHPALIFWAAQLGRFDTAKRLVEAGVSLDRGMIRNESMTYLKLRTADFTPRQLYQDLRILNHQINPHDTLGRVGPRGFVGEPFKPRPRGAGFDMGHFAHWRSWWFPLHLAVLGGHTDLVGLFISSGAILDVPSGNLCNCKYPLLATPGGHPAVQFRRAWTPLHTAICSGHIDIAKTLLHRGASLSFGEHSKHIPHPFTVLHNAACVGSTELVDYILDGKYQTDVQLVDTTEMSPLWLAYIQGHWDVVDTLLARGADINDDLAAGYTPLSDACLFGEFSSALKLVTRGADVNVVCTAFPIVFSRYRYQVTHNLLTCLRGHRPIDLCCMKQQSATRSIRYRKDPPNPRYGPGAHEAMIPPPSSEPVPSVDESLRTPVVQALLDAGADIGPCEHSPSLVPPIVAAAAEHLVDVVRLLLDRGAEVDSRDKDGNTPLMAALNYALHWCPSHAKVGPLSTRPFGLQRPARTVPVPAHPMPPPPGMVFPGIPPPQPVQVPPPQLVHAPPPQVVHIGNNPPLLVPALPVIVIAPPPAPPKPPSCRQKGDFTACVKLLVERGASSTATNSSGDTALSLVYSPDAAPDKRYSSGRPRGHLTFKERAVVVSMLLDLGADPNTRVNILRADETNSDIESDDPNAYSASDSDDSLNTATASDYASSAGSFRPPRRRKYRSLYTYGPLSVLQCAFWDGDLDLCRSLLARGAELSTPTVAWMLHVAWGYCRWRMRDAADRVLQVLGDLEVSRQTELGSHPACLYVLITQGVRHMAADLLELGIERGKFDDVPGPDYAWLFGDKTTSQSTTWGDLCLAQAVRTGWLAGIEPLLQLGLGVNPSPDGLEPAKSPLRLAIRRRDAAMVNHLVRHGASVTLSDDSDAVKFTRGERRYPLVVAIRTEEPDIISALLRERKDPLPERFAYAYIRESYMTRRPKALNCLLTFSCLLDPHCRSPDKKKNTHLIEIMSSASAICNHQQPSPTGSGADTDDEDGGRAGGVWSYSIKSKLEKVRMWIECLIVLTRAGVSPTVKNDAGVSAIDLFEGLVNYRGPDRFRIHVRSALRSRLNDVMGVMVWDDSLSAEAAFEALGRCEVNLEESDASASSDGTIDD
jgi:ankyrin repeat protein